MCGVCVCVCGECVCVGVCCVNVCVVWCVVGVCFVCVCVWWVCVLCVCVWCVCVCVAQSTKITSLSSIIRFVLVMKHAYVFCGVGPELLILDTRRFNFSRVPPCRLVKLPTSHKNTVLPSSTATMEALCSLETLVTRNQSTRRIIIINTALSTSDLASYRLQIVC